MNPYQYTWLLELSSLVPYEFINWVLFGRGDTARMGGCGTNWKVCATKRRAGRHRTDERMRHKLESLWTKRRAGRHRPDDIFMGCITELFFLIFIQD